MVAEIEETVLALTRRGGLSVLLVEQHVGFAMRAARRYYVLEAGRVTSSGDGERRRRARYGRRSACDASVS